MLSIDWDGRIKAAIHKDLNEDNASNDVRDQVSDVRDQVSDVRDQVSEANADSPRKIAQIGHEPAQKRGPCNTRVAI